MKFLKTVFVLVAIVLMNLSIVQPSLADPNYRKNPDYIEVTKTLKNLQENAEGAVPEDVQRQIGELEFQKAAIESGVVWGQCHNETGGNLGIYGTGSKESEESGNKNQLYFLANGQTTPDQWDCQGVYLPSDVNVAALDKTGAVAVKIMDGTQISVKIGFTDLAFSLDSVTAAVAVSSKTWLVVTGCILGIIALRFMAGLFVRWIAEFTYLLDAAYLTVLVVGSRLMLKALIPGHVPPKWIILSLIIALFTWGFSQRVAPGINGDGTLQSHENKE